MKPLYCSFIFIAGLSHLLNAMEAAPISLGLRRIETCDNLLALSGAMQSRKSNAAIKRPRITIKTDFDGHWLLSEHRLKVLLNFNPLEPIKWCHKNNYLIVKIGPRIEIWDLLIGEQLLAFCNKNYSIYKIVQKPTQFLTMYKKKYAKKCLVY